MSDVPFEVEAWLKAASTRRVPPVPLTGPARAALDNRGQLGYGSFRPKQGPNGTWHWGLDLVSPDPSIPDYQVVSPEAGIVEHAVGSVRKDGEMAAPWSGYGPAIIVIRGRSGKYHLLAHLDFSSFAVYKGQPVAPGQVLARMSRTLATPHTHWEVRLEAVDSGPAKRAYSTVDPVAWLNAMQRPLGGAGAPNPEPAKTSWWWMVALWLLASGERRR